MRYTQILSLQTGKFFLFAFGSFWTFLEFCERYKLVVVQAPNAMVGFGTICLSAIVAIGSSTLAELKNQNRQIETLYRQMQVRAAALRVIHQSIMVERSYFKLLFLDWRLQVELEKSRITNGGSIMLPAKKAFDYTIYVFSSLLHRLQHTDTFMTVSNLNFWSRVRFGEGHFLSENLRAAARGVSIRRIVVLDRDTLAVGFGPEWEQLSQFVKRLYQHFTHNRKHFDAIEWLFYLSDNFDIDGHEPVPYAVLTNEALQEHMAIVPYIAKHDQEESKINVYFSSQKDDQEINRLIDRYEGLRSQPANLFNLQDFYEKIFLPASQGVLSRSG